MKRLDLVQRYPTSVSIDRVGKKFREKSCVTWNTYRENIYIYIYRERSIKMEGDRRGVSRRSSVKRVAI